MLGNQPSDGSVIGLIGSAIWIAPKLDSTVADFDPLGLRWLGSLSPVPDAMCIVSKALGIKSVAQFTEDDFILGATGRTSTGYYFAAATKKVLGANYRIVTAFEGIAELELALLRGEIAGHCFAGAEDLRRPEFGDFVNVILRFTGPDDSPYADAPRLRDIIENDATREAVMLLEGTREFDFQFVAPKGTPDETVSILRDALNAVVADPQYQSEMRTVDGFVLGPMPGGDLEQVLREKLESDPEIFDLARELIE